jgi:hypothetical protein
VIYRKGELSPATVDRGWPHQVALPESQATGSGHKIIRAFCANLSLCDRGHAVYHEDKWWQVFCFAEKSTPKNSCNGSAARNSTRSKEGREAIGRSGTNRASFVA